MVWPAIPFLMRAPVDPSGHHPTELLTTHLLYIGELEHCRTGSSTLSGIFTFANLPFCIWPPLLHSLLGCLSIIHGLGPCFSKQPSWEPGGICLSPGELKMLNLISQECSQITNSPLSNIMFSSLHPPAPPSSTFRQLVLSQFRLVHGELVLQSLWHLIPILLNPEHLPVGLCWNVALGDWGGGEGSPVC